MFNLYKYENMLYVMELSGKEIKGFLEMSYAMWTNQMKSADDHLLLFKQPIEEGKRANFEYYSFNFDSAAGINYTVDVTKPRGEKINILSMADGTPFDMDKENQATYLAVWWKILLWTLLKKCPALISC